MTLHYIITKDNKIQSSSTKLNGLIAEYVEGRNEQRKIKQRATKLGQISTELHGTGVLNPSLIISAEESRVVIHFVVLPKDCKDQSIEDIMYVRNLPGDSKHIHITSNKIMKEKQTYNEVNLVYLLSKHFDTTFNE